MNTAKEIEKEIAPIRADVTNHTLYSTINSVEDVKLFMQTHVFAVWDFMSMVKALQNQLTCTTTPWQPVKNAKVARFINEIVVEEETDTDIEGNIKSHFEMYLSAMEQIGAETTSIAELLDHLNAGKSIFEALNYTKLPKPIYDFLHFTFSLIQTNEPHKIAAAFTFGREDLIPDMFLQIIKETKNEENYNKLTYYLQRHIDLDGDEHGPLALMMIEELCEGNPMKIKQAKEASLQALELRNKLWNHVLNQIINANSIKKTALESA
ncbi:MAG: DUF3050 domain-containing protein [Parvicellaceae bacterium]